MTDCGQGSLGPEVGPAHCVVPQSQPHTLSWLVWEKATLG